MIVRTTAGQTASEPRRAIIDIGSNTIRLVIYGGPNRAPATLLNEKIGARLGRGLADHGRLSPKATAAGLTELRRMAAILRLHGVDDVTTVATAAVRDAANGAEFLAEVERIGLSPRLLSGEEEAEASALGVIAAFPHARGVVADLGGGSLELVGIADGAITHGVSLPLGSLRLPKLREDGSLKFARRVRKLLHQSDWDHPERQPLYLVGGSTRAFATYAINRLDWPLDDPHGFELDSQTALRFATGATHGKPDAAFRGLSGMRAAALPDAAALLRVLIRTLRPERLVFSGWGLREGLLYRRLDTAARNADPLIAAAEWFSRRNGLAPELARQVARWIGGAMPDGGQGGPSLLLAATMLTLASNRIEPNLRGAEAVQWALRKRWIGLEAEGRGMLAACFLAHAGTLALPAEVERIAGAEALAAAQAWGLAIRLCRRFTTLASDALEQSRLRIRGRDLVLESSRALADLTGEATPRDLATLAARLGLNPAFSLAD